MDAAIEHLAANRKLERVATYKQIQGLSNQIQHLTSGKLSIADFSMPRPDARGREWMCCRHGPSDVYVRVMSNVCVCLWLIFLKFIYSALTQPFLSLS